MIYERAMSDADIEAMIEAEPFGRGTARVAYRLKNDPDCIVKKSIRPRHYSNILEWTIWLGAENHPELAGILGRCQCLSFSGQYLIMECLDDIYEEDYNLVPGVPVWFNDKKPSAFGKRNGVIKIRDYGLVSFDELLNRNLDRPPAFALNVQMAARFQRPNGA